MKKILIVLIVSLIAFSCEPYGKVDGKTELSQEIILGLKDIPIDSVIFVSDDNYHYYFKNVDDNWILNERYLVNNNEYVPVHWLYFLFVLAIGILLGVWIKN